MTILLSNGLPRSVREIPQGFQRWGAGHSSGLITSRYKTMAYEEIYRAQPAVFSVINRLLEGICRIPIKVYQFGKDGDSRSRVREHPLAKLMSEPWKGHAQWELKERLGFDLLLHGSALAWKLRPGPGRPPVEIWPIPWWSVIPVWDMRGFLAFQIMLDGVMYTLPPEDCVYLELVGRGTSPIEPLRRTIGIEDHAMDWQDEALASGVSARAVFSTKINMANEAAVKATREQIDELYSGPSGKKFAIMGENSDIKVLNGLSAVDIGLIQARQAAREDVCSCYGVQPSVLGFTTTGQPATYASAREWRQAFYVDGIGPKITLFEEMLDMQLVKSELMWADTFLKFDMRELLRPDPEAQARADLMDMQSGTTVSNERRKDRGLAAIGNPTDPNNPANLPWVAGNGYPLGSSPVDMGESIKKPAQALLLDGLTTEAFAAGAAPHNEQEG